MVELPEYKPFPHYEAVDLLGLVPKLKGTCNWLGNGVLLLERMLEYSPELRISAEEALSHAFFQEE
jgi:hypothetical protein